MKKGLTYFTVFAVIGLFTIVGCKKTVQDAVNNTISTYLYTTLQSGYWTITRYSEGSHDSTLIFNNWKTYFKDNNVMLSLYDSSGKFIDTTYGSWSNSDLYHFSSIYNTGTKYPLNKISDNWNIAAYSSGSTPATKTVTFARTTYGHPDTLMLQNH